MHLVWEKKRSSTTVAFPHDRIWAQFEVRIDMPRERAWDYLIQPKFRNTLIGSDRMEIANRSNGRIVAGSIYQCYHGDKLVPQTILEWQPFERMIVRELSPMFPGSGGLSEYRLDAMEGGTILTKTLARPTGPFLGRTLLHLLMPIFKRLMAQVFEQFKREIESDYREHHKALERETELTNEQIRDAASASLHASSNGQQT